MANTVQANVDVNIKSNTSSFDKGMQDAIKQIQALIDEAHKLNSAGEDNLGGLSVSAEQVAESLSRISAGSAFDEFNEEVKGTNININDLSGLLTVLTKNIGLSNSEAASFTKALGATAGEAAIAGAAIGAYIAVLKTYVELIKSAYSDITKFGEGALSAGINGIEFFVDTIQNLVESLEEAIERMEEFAEAGAEIQTAYFNTFTILGSEAGNEIANFADKLQNLYGLDGSQLVMDMKSIVGAAGSLGVSTGDAVKATENMTIMANNLSMLAGSFEKASNDIGNAISKANIAKNSSLYYLLTKQEKEALREYDTEVERYNYLMSLSGRIKERYIQFLGTEAGQLMLLKQQYGQLIGNISQLALGLYAKIAPVLTKLIQLANIALTYIMKVFNIDLKGSADVGTSSIADGISNAMKSAGDSSKKAAKDIKKSTKDSGKAIKELERQVASFDDVIQIKDNKANDDLINLDGLDSGLDDIGDLDSGLQDLIGDFDLLGEAIDKTDNEFKDFIDKLNAGDYEGAGAWLADWVADKLWSIDWKGIQLKAGKAGAAIADFLNSISKDKRLWAGIGHTLAEGIDSAVDFLLNFADLFEFSEFGDSLAVAWKQFWDDFDEIDAAEALYKWFVGIFETLGSFFDKNPLSTMTRSIVTMINNFFSNITDEDISNMSDTLISILNDVFNAALVLTEGLEEGEAGEKIQQFITDLLSKVSENAGFWGQTLGNLIKTVLNFLYDAISNADKSGLSDSIAEFLGGLDLGGIFDEWFKLKMEFIWIIIESAIKTIFTDIKNKITGESETNIGDALEAVVTLIGGLLGNLFFKIGSFIGEKITELMTSTGNSLGTGLQDIWGNIENGWNKVWSTIQEWLSPDKWKKIGIGALNGLFNGIKEIWNSIKQWWNTYVAKDLSFSAPSWLGGKTVSIRIPRLATGGIVDKSTIANIGEAGKEAVLPLERNTEWMDTLAEKINGKDSNDNTPITIDLSKCIKTQYTRPELLAMAEVTVNSLKAYGVAVSLEY